MQVEMARFKDLNAVNKQMLNIITYINCFAASIRGIISFPPPSAWLPECRNIQQIINFSKILPSKDMWHQDVTPHVPNPGKTYQHVPRPTTPKQTLCSVAVVSTRYEWLVSSSTHISKSCCPCLSCGHWLQATEIQHYQNPWTTQGSSDAVHQKLEVNHRIRLAIEVVRRVHLQCQSLVVQKLRNTPRWGW